MAAGSACTNLEIHLSVPKLTDIEPVTNLGNTRSMDCTLKLRNFGIPPFREKPINSIIELIAGIPIYGNTSKHIRVTKAKR